MNKKFSKAILTWTVVGSFLGYTALPSYADYTQVVASYDNFAKTAGFTLNKGTATSNPNGVGALVDGQNVLRLVTSARWQVGTAFLTNKVSFAGLKSFSSDFTFQIRDEYPLGAGADGLTFVIQSTANNFVGWYGGDLGYSGLTKSVGLEFDTHVNTQYNDPNDNHVGLDLNGSLTSIKTANPPGRLSTGIWHAWVDYEFASQQMQLRLSQDNNRPLSPILSENVPLTSILGSDQAFIGFTSATGERWANHDLLSFHMKTVVQQNIAQIGVNATQPKLGETASTVTATLTDDNNRPVPNEKVAFTTSFGEITGYGITDENGVATATLTAKESGTAIVTATAANGLAGTTSVDFTFPLVNNAPSFKAGSNLTINKSQTAPQAYANFATDISAGPDKREADQKLSFAAANDNEQLFTAQPAIDANGTLTFTAKDNVSGLATVKVALHDDGGTENGGHDTSAEQMFTILVDTINPTITDLVQSPTEWTKDSVTVGAAFDGTGTAVAAKKWAAGKQDASYFATAGNEIDNAFAATENGTYTLYVKDQVGNTAVQTVTISNIDRTAPATTVSTKTATDGTTSVTLTATDAQSGVSKTEYRLNGGAWTTYAAPVQVPATFAGTVEYRSTDKAGNVEDVKSLQLALAPIEATVTADPSILWSPDHKLATINTKVNATSPVGIDSIVLTSITSSQADNGSGDGNTTQDIQGAAFGSYDTQFQLRAERDGGTTEDRVYTITYTITDKLGRKALATCTVTVPHDKNAGLTDASLVAPAEQPTDTTVQPAPVTDNTPTTTYEQSPVPSTGQSAPTTDQPAPSTDQAASTTDQAASTTEQTASTTEQTASTTEQTASTTDQTASTTDQPTPAMPLPVTDAVQPQSEPEAL